MKKPFPLRPPADASRSAVNTLRQIVTLQELAEIGMGLLRRLAQHPRPPDGDVVRSFDTLSQAVRRTIALESALDGGQRLDAVARAAKRAQVMRDVSRAAEQAPDPAEPDPEPGSDFKTKTGRFLN